MNRTSLRALLPLLATIALGPIAGCAAEAGSDTTDADPSVENAASTTQAMTLTVGIDRDGTLMESASVGVSTRAARCQKLATDLRALEALKPPFGFDLVQSKSWARQDALFESHAVRCLDWVAAASKTSFAEKLGGLLPPPPEDYDAMADDVAQSTQSFVTITNASKARHDVAMNAIRNMK